MTVGEASRGWEVGVGCWEQLRNEPRTSTNILCALELALEPPQPIHHCGILSDPGCLPGARGQVEGGRGLTVSMAETPQLAALWACSVSEQGSRREEAPAALLIQFV